ncbi:MAG: hypothetical protein RL536_186 [Candidatus Parcubacteria bacterium]|jgi:ribonuclease R
MLKNPHKSAKKTLLTGVISTTQKGAGYIDDADPNKDSIYFEPGTLNTAMNGDTVEFTVNTKIIRGEKTRVGTVTRIIERSKQMFVGTVSSATNSDGFIATADDKKLYVPINILAGQKLKIKKNDKVYLRLQPWTDSSANPEGDVIRVLGQKGVNNVEMEAIVLECGFEVGFPKAVLKDAQTIETNKVITKEEIAKRRNMSGVTTFTIDPFDAKDFDDAISFRRISSKALGNGGEMNSDQNEPRIGVSDQRPQASGGHYPSHSGELYEIGIHIADVSHYVREKTALDKEAIKRGCSVYLVDRTIPMLPEVLSNDVCSLNPHEDKLTFSAIFTIDDKAKIHSRWFGRTMINSTHRFTYEDAQATIDGRPPIHHTETDTSGFRDDLVILNNLAKIMRKKNAAMGAIEFEKDEIKFRLDQNGKPLGVYAKKRLDVHKLVEEYMLLANREVAKFIFDSIKKKGRKDTGSLYRIHDVPDKEKIKDLQIFVKLMGYDLRAKDGVVTAKDINHLLDQIEGTAHESLIRTATVRSMQKAVYSTNNIGHFGLAFPFYTHFTSPIRRYPDVLVHRTLSRHLNNEPFGNNEVVALQKMAESSTAREIDAAHAERDSIKLKQVEYMSEHIGGIYTGTISGVAKWGVYVEENETKCEGVIPVAKLGDDYFNFNEKTYSMVGEKSGKKYTLGDKVKFKVISADLDKRQSEFGLVN